MSLNTNQISAEERKKNREKFMIKDKQNETIYRHYGDLNGADFKLRKNIKCEIYILDWSKGMYIDDCEDCKIVVGPIDGSVFIRGSKNCEFSIIARQVRFRNCENLKVFTYCPSDPAVESSFNIYFAPFNAFFPHLKELFIKGEFKKEEKNHIDTPYDFTPGEELGGGAEHYLKLPEEDFYIKVVNDGNSPVEEMYEGYSKEEPLVQNKASEIPNFELTDNNRENDDFNFISENRNGNENKNDRPSVQPTLNDFIIPSNNQKEEKINNNDNNNFMNMDDFLTTNINLSDQNKQNNTFDFNSNNNKGNDLNTNNNNFMDFFGENNNNNNISQPKINLDFNDDFNNFNVGNIQNNNNAFDNTKIFFTNNMSNNMSKEVDEEMKRQELRNKEKEVRQERIKQKMEKEAKMRMEIMRKASEYINQFYEERKKRIALNHEKLMQSGGKQNTNSNGGSPWGMVESSFTGNTSNADRMKEVILHKNRDLNK